MARELGRPHVRRAAEKCADRRKMTTAFWAALAAGHVRTARARAQGAPGAEVKGKVALITGASTGIGKATALGLAKGGYGKIFLAGHDEAKTQAAIRDLKAKSEAELEYLPLELANLGSVRSAAQAFQATSLPLHALICNAAVMALPERRVTEDGHEYQLEVNYLSHFLLVNLLLPQLTAAGSQQDPARIINVSSSAHFVRSPLGFGDAGQLDAGQVDYYPWTAYGQSKLAQVMFTYELARRLQKQGLPVVANVLDPGIVDTELQRYLPTRAPEAVMKFAKSPEQGAETSVLLATAAAGRASGGYWVDGKRAESLGKGASPLPLNKELAVEGTTSYDPKVWEALWRRSAELVLDVGGEPGFLAAALLSRGIPVTVVDLSWGKTGKNNHTTQIEDMEEAGLPEHARFRAVPAAFDESFVAEHRELVEACSALVSLYGDEATTPCLHYEPWLRTSEAVGGGRVFHVSLRECRSRQHPPTGKWAVVGGSGFLFTGGRAA
ncbi:unnamed protein product [Effrenium voratum]|uniref:Uncharacterized protein n=1 Tax=Effrenium voratum TaxID=2562239 RepID=A0AA36HT66_9DINO|nr:unnamed protein product [Effrenium voratum]